MANVAMRNANTAEQASMVSKCARFFKTLIHLSQQPDQQQGQQTAVRVTELVKVIFFTAGTMELYNIEQGVLKHFKFEVYESQGLTCSQLRYTSRA